VVERVTFHNPENGFCVLRVKARGQRDLITVIGHAATITAGEFVQASGAWVNDLTHGRQFRAVFLKASPPTTLEGIERYLGSGMIRGIGPVYAHRLAASPLAQSTRPGLDPPPRRRPVVSCSRGQAAMQKTFYTACEGPLCCPSARRAIPSCFSWTFPP